MSASRLVAALFAALAMAAGPAAAFELPAWQSAHFRANPLAGLRALPDPMHLTVSSAM